MGPVESRSALDQNTSWVTVETFVFIIRGKARANENIYTWVSV